jgi:DNA-binding IclR family transcriptional regulator
MDTWSVGELAAQTGLTVRTLHHYDEIGLARPTRRSAAGHRAMVAKLSPQELEEMATRQRAMRESLTPEQLAALEPSWPPLPR